MINAGLLLDLAQLETTGAEGVGLFRTEFPLMVRDTFPDVEDLTEYYQRVFEQAQRSSGAVPHPRYRRRQGAALPAACRRGQPGDGLAGDPHRARPPGDAAPAIAGADPCGAAAGRCSSSSRWSPRWRSSNAPAPSSISSWRARRGRADRCPRRSRSASCWRCPHCSGSCRRCAGGSISCRSEPTICCSFCSPAIAAIRGSPSATTRSRRRCWRCFAR